MKTANKQYTRFTEQKEWLEYHLERSSYSSTLAIISCLIGCALQGYKWQELELWEIPGFVLTTRYFRYKRQYRMILRSEKALSHLYEDGSWTAAYRIAIGKELNYCPMCGRRW